MVTQLIFNPSAEPAVVRKKECGDCTMCCKLLGIKEIAKPPAQWCPHCLKGKGCGVYEERPQSCRDYECAYLMAFDDTHSPPLGFRPDKCKVVFSPGLGSVGEGQELLVAHVDPGYPLAWEAPIPKQVILATAKRGTKVVIGVGDSNTKIVFEKNARGQITRRDIAMSAPDENGVQWWNG